MFVLGVLSPIGFLVGLSTIDYSTKSSTNLLSTPIFDLGFHPDDRTSTQRNLLWKISLLHQSINGGFRETSDFFDLFQSQKMRMDHVFACFIRFIDYNNLGVRLVRQGVSDLKDPCRVSDYLILRQSVGLLRSFVCEQYNPGNPTRRFSMDTLTN